MIAWVERGKRLAHGPAMMLAVMRDLSLAIGEDLAPSFGPCLVATGRAGDKASKLRLPWLCIYADDAQVPAGLAVRQAITRQVRERLRLQLGRCRRYSIPHRFLLVHFVSRSRLPGWS